MKLLIYIHPLVFAGGPHHNSGWLSVLSGMLRGLAECSESVHCVLVTGDRFMQAYDARSFYLDSVIVRTLDEVALHVALRKLSATPSRQSTLIYGGETEAGHPAMRLLAEAVGAAVGHEEFDVLLSFGIQTDFLRPLFPQALPLCMEIGPFARNPYPLSFYFDHLGMFKRSVVGRHGETIRDLPPPDGDLASLVDDTRQWARGALLATDEQSSWDIRAQFDKVMLLPLQASNYYSFDDDCGYRSQFEYLLDVLLQTPREIGVVVTEYNQHGDVLADEGPRASLDYLRSAFPNLLFHPGTRKLAAASQHLIPKVDGIWSISSNVAIQGLLYDRVLGSQEGTYLSRIAHAQGIPGFSARLALPAPDCSGATAWLLSRYYVPDTLVSDGAWLCRYFAARIAAAAQADPLAAFVPLADPDRLRRAWLGAAPAPQTNVYISPSQDILRRELKLRWALAESTASPQPMSFSSDFPATGTELRGRYLLLNDTRALEGNLHLGCSVTVDYIHARFAAAGLSCVATANDKAEVDALWNAGTLNGLDLVVMNGETSVQFEPARIDGLLDACGMFREAGIRTALINAVWPRHCEALVYKLAYFDIVAVTDSTSLDCIRSAGGSARVVPHVAFAGFAALPRPMAASPLPLVVIDSGLERTTDALLDFAAFAAAPFLLMGQAHGRRLLESPLVGHRAGGAAFPRILQALDDVMLGAACVTGRFYGLMAALSLGVPVLALPSRTHRAEAVLRDAGLLDVAMLPEDWVESGQYRRRALIDEKVAAWQPDHHTRARRYAAQACQDIEAMFRDVTALAFRGKSIEIPPSRFWSVGASEGGAGLWTDFDVLDYFIAGPYIELPPGRWSIVFRTAITPFPTGGDPCHVRFDVYNFDREKVYADRDMPLPNGNASIDPLLEFVHDGDGRLEFRLFLRERPKQGRLGFFGVRLQALYG